MPSLRALCFFFLYEFFFFITMSLRRKASFAACFVRTDFPLIIYRVAGSILCPSFVFPPFFSGFGVLCPGQIAEMEGVLHSRNSETKELKVNARQTSRRGGATLTRDDKETRREGAVLRS